MKTKFTRTGENEIKFEDLSIENARFALSRNFEYLRGWLEDGTNYYSLRRFGKINGKINCKADGAKRRCQAKLERLVRVLFASYRKGGKRQG